METTAAAVTTTKTAATTTTATVTAEAVMDKENYCVWLMKLPLLLPIQPWLYLRRYCVIPFFYLCFSMLLCACYALLSSWFPASSLSIYHTRASAHTHREIWGDRKNRWDVFFSHKVESKCDYDTLTELRRTFLFNTTADRIREGNEIRCHSFTNSQFDHKRSPQLGV